nr:hypothetical protein CFP56_54826 [Quercus suber]
MDFGLGGLSKALQLPTRGKRSSDSTREEELCDHSNSRETKRGKILRLPLINPRRPLFLAEWYTFKASTRLSPLISSVLVFQLSSKFQVPTCVEKSEAMNVGASTSPFSPNIADTLGDVIIFTAAGDPVFFKDLWDQNQVCVYVFIISRPFFVSLLGLISEDWSLSFFGFQRIAVVALLSFEALWMPFQVITN